MIQLFHVDKLYGKDAALADVTLHIERGELVFLTGASGAGKSTLLKLIFAAETPTRGQILVGGRNIARLTRAQIPYLRRTIGVVFQDFKLIPTRTVFDNVAYTLEVLGMERREIARRVSSILRDVGLGHRMASYPQKLSGGEQQRVAIARALVNDPQILLADEPTGNLDAEVTIDVLRLITSQNARGTTVVFATHDQGLLQRNARRVITLAGGRMTST